MLQVWGLGLCAALGRRGLRVRCGMARPIQLGGRAGVGVQGIRLVRGGGVGQLKAQRRVLRLEPLQRRCQLGILPF